VNEGGGVGGACAIGLPHVVHEEHAEGGGGGIVVVMFLLCSFGGGEEGDAGGVADVRGGRCGLTDV